MISYLLASSPRPSYLHAYDDGDASYALYPLYARVCGASYAPSFSFGPFLLVPVPLVPTPLVLAPLVQITLVQLPLVKIPLVLLPWVQLPLAQQLLLLASPFLYYSHLEQYIMQRMHRQGSIS
jgi:hypothetical protein